MKFDFTVGAVEHHRLEFSFDPVLGDLKVTVDGNPVEEDLRLFLSMIERYEFTVGEMEQHKVAIEKDRQKSRAGLRNLTYLVFVDDKLAQRIER